MTTSKPWYLSRGVWGGVVSLAAGVAGLFGIGVDPAAGEALAAGLTSIAGTLGALVAIVGRMRADTTIRAR